MSGRFKLPRWEVFAAITVVLLLTVGLWAGKVITTSGALVAYATAMLALGSFVLAGGAIGLLREQRNAESRKSEQAAEDDIACVMVNRISGPGQYLRVEVRNNSRRAIRDVYVWADVERVSGRYHAVVLDADPRTGQLRLSRRMRLFPVMMDAKELYRSFRAIFPGQFAIFDQDTQMNQCRDPVLDVDNASIKTWAMFASAAGTTWWKCSEDGEIVRLDEPPALAQEVEPQLGHGTSDLPHLQLPSPVAMQQGRGS